MALILFVTFTLTDVSVRNKIISQHHPQLLDAINSNGLLFFLLSNLLTGVINMTITTRIASDLTAFIVVFLYMIFLCSVSTRLFVNKWVIKFW